MMASQMGKTDNLLNVAGHRIDDDPVPVLFITPTKSNAEKVIEPRFMKMVRSSESLHEKHSGGKKSTKTYKNIAGVSFRLAWSGSATELASDPACVVMVDERDRMDDDIEGEGDPVELADARHATYPDGTTVVTSTPTVGSVETKVDPVSGLEIWAEAEPENIQSAVWKLWQEGTRFEWSWPCPDCDKYFIPRFKLLKWPEKSTPNQALRKTQLACPHCGSLINDSQKTEMNARGVYVAPGQKVTKGGVVKGNPPESDTASYWVSGLCSPWRSFGQRARSFLAAVDSGDSGRIQGVINTGFGELYRVAGDAPDWEEVEKHKLLYLSGDVPSGIKKLTASVDIQKDRLVYSIRGFGYEMESWLIEAGELWGDTLEKDVWKELEKFKTIEYEGYRIVRLMVDTGYRKDTAYKFCRKHKGWAVATKGASGQQDKPIKVSLVDVDYGGKTEKKGLQLWILDTDYFKTWVHDRVRAENDIWHLPSDITEDYCKQIVAEAKAVKPSGQSIWITVKKDNHYLDCEMMNVAAAYSLKFHMAKKPDDGGQPVKRKRRRRKGTVSEVKL